MAWNGTFVGSHELLAKDTFLLDADGAKKLSGGPWQVSTTNEGVQVP